MSRPKSRKRFTNLSMIVRAIVDGFVAIYPWKLLLFPPPPPPENSMEQALERVSRAFNRSWMETKMTFESTLARDKNSGGDPNGPPQTKRSRAYGSA